jgi:hypothetical protein
MAKKGIIKTIIPGICMGIVASFILLLIAVFWDKYQHDLTLSFKCFNKSFEERYRVYANTLDETPGNFYRQRKALNKIRKMGDAVIPLIIEDVLSEKGDFRKKRALLDLVGIMNPNIYCNIMAGIPYFKKNIDAQLLKESLCISYLKEANISSEQRAQILKRLESLGEEYKSKYEEYKEFCDSQDDITMTK